MFVVSMHVVNAHEVPSAPIGMRCPVTGELSQQNIKDRYYGVNDPVAMKLLNKAGDMPSLEPPEDESIKTLYVGGLDARISEQDLRDQFYAHGEIESVKMVPQRAIAFVTYTTREGAEKAAQELSNKLVIKGLRLKLMWGRPQAPKPEQESSEEARQQAAMAHSGMLPRAVVSQQHNHFHPPGTQDQHPPMHYFNIPPPPQQERAYYPSMDPQRMGALVGSQDGNPNGPTGSGEDKSGLEKQQGQHYPYQSVPPPHLQYQQQPYPPYGYMPPMPPYQQYPQPYHTPLPPPQVVQSTQQYQHPVPSPMAAPAGSMNSAPSSQGSRAPAGSMASGPPPQGAEAAAGSKPSGPPSPRPGEPEESKPSGPPP
ncbi:hypothetical protein OIU76_014792 [Salix suchowensis]|nr:hypothetical protein OIU76_014792 [Salix suchowensis]